MILTSLNDQSFEYDVRGLLTSFYPREEIKFFITESEEDYEKFEKAVEEAQGAPTANVSGTDAEAAAVEKLRVLTISASPGYVYIAVSQEGEFFSTPDPEAYECDDRLEVKRVMKRELYRLLRTANRKELPWGTLTGIRPTNIVLKILDEAATQEGGDSESVIEEALKRANREMRMTYLVGPEKTALSLKIAEKEHRIVSAIADKTVGHVNGLMPDGYSLYVGIPFCPTRCLYCSFASNPIDKCQKLIPDYLSALEAELDLTAELFTDKCLHTVYVGGGTPTSLSAEELDRLLGAIAERFDTDKLFEYCVEAGRPDTVTREKLEVLKKYGVTRISVNPQTMNQKTLDIIGRKHTVEHTVEAFKLARELGFNNINMDIILGLPEEGEEDVKNTLAQIKELAPDSLTVHSLAIKRAARLSTERESLGELHIMNNDELMNMAIEAAEAMGLEPYYLYRQKNMAGNLENVGFAKPGLEGIYNILMMEERESIAACGAGTISKCVMADGRIERADNVKDVALFMERLPEMLDRKRKLYKEGE